MRRAVLGCAAVLLASIAAEAGEALPPVDNFEALGPAIMAKAALEPQGRWEDLKRDMFAMFEDANESGDGSFRVQVDYLVTVAELPA